MILVTVGTQDKKFNRLLKLVDDEIIKGNILDEVIVQAGCSDYKSDNMKMFNLISEEEFNKYLKKADVVITHGGVGSIVSSIKLGKKVIACPRLSKYMEHTNDHQCEICDKFMELGYIKVLNDGDDLGNVLNSIKDFIPKKYVSNTKNIIDTLENYIDKL